MRPDPRSQDADLKACVASRKAARFLFAKELASFVHCEPVSDPRHAMKAKCEQGSLPNSSKFLLRSLDYMLP